jgi:hypothetical protein
MLRDIGTEWYMPVATQSEARRVEASSGGSKEAQVHGVAIESAELASDVMSLCSRVMSTRVCTS